jgi:hypothetical protein
MKRLFAWLAGLAGGLAAYKALTRRPEPAPAVDPRAEELAARIAESRATPEEQAPEEPAELDPQARRDAVHDTARAAIDEMRGTSA